LLSTAAQKPAVGQETESRWRAIESIMSGDDQELPLKVSTLPLPSTAAQKRAVGQETKTEPPAFVSKLVAADQCKGTPLVLGADATVVVEGDDVLVQAPAARLKASTPAASTTGALVRTRVSFAQRAGKRQTRPRRRCRHPSCPFMPHCGSGPSISRHLSLLEAAGLVRERRDANRIYYSLVQERLALCVGGFLSAPPVTDNVDYQGRAKLHETRH
jgi:hypothetical protein